MKYDQDFYKWTKTQAGFLKKGEFEKLDLDNLKEEIEALGRGDKRALLSHCIVLLTHLLKLKYQTEKQMNSNFWKSSVLNSTREIKILIKDSPSLKNEIIKIFPEAYEDARQSAAIETQLDIKIFPEKCPWDLFEILPFAKKKNK